MTNTELAIMDYLDGLKNEIAMNLDCCIEEYYQGQYQIVKQIQADVRRIIENGRNQ
jgi:hypothetical protein